MDNNQGMIGMALGSWLVALAGGVLAAVLLWVLGGWGFMQGAFVGVLVFLVFGAIISWIMTRPLPGPGETTVGADAPAEAPKAAAPAKPAAAAPAAAQPAATTEAAKVKPSKHLPGQEELSARKGEWKYEKEPDAAAAAESGGTAQAAANAPASSEAATDDLKLISGVGPALEKKLHDAGIHSFEQIANMSAEDIERIEAQLSFKGRMQRDDWMGQARTLADGGETEFSRKKRKS